MAQRRSSHSMPKLFIRPIVFLKDEKEIAAWSKTMEDLNLHHTDKDWKLLRWWADFCQRSVPALPLDDKLKLQRELVVLECLGTRSHGFSLRKPPPPLSFPQIELLRLRVLTLLKNLADHGMARFGPFPVTWEVHQPPSFDNQSKSSSKRLVVTDITGTGSVPNRQDVFLVQLQELLKIVPQEVRRCLHCARLFLQIKRQARYCGRRCQSVAAMRRIRALQSERKKTKRSKHAKGVRRRNGS